jgi:predicted  nucleic acid-binding Zn-ribbon protein
MAQKTASQEEIARNKRAWKRIQESPALQSMKAALDDLTDRFNQLQSDMARVNIRAHDLTGGDICLTGPISDQYESTRATEKAIWALLKAFQEVAASE